MLDPTSIWAENQSHPWASLGPVPYSYNADSAPLSYAETFKEDHIEPPTRLTAPDNQFVALLKEKIAFREAPDPIRESDFWAAGNKIKPDARMWITSHLAIPYHESISEQTHRIGKLIGYLKVPTHVGGQAPSVYRANIQERSPTTYGSLYEVSPIPSPQVPAFTSSGFENIGVGYPYE
jgi:hypothetical protein